MVLIGILLGFGAALSQSCAFLFSRMYMRKVSDNPLQLLAIAHIFMAAGGAAILPFFLTPEVWDVRIYIFPLIGCAVFYMTGQTFFFSALKDCDASRLSPLLGIKIFILAFISVIFLKQSFSPGQWLGISLAIIAIAVFNWSGKSIHLKAFLKIICACTGFSLSDICIRFLVDSFPNYNLLHRTILTASMTYIVCGVISIIIVFFIKKNKPLKGWKYTMGFTVSWFTGIILLFGCFAVINVVFGNIIQSTRGIISVILGFFISRRGYEILEQKTDPGIFIRRIIGASMITAAIALFYMYK